MVFSDIYIYTPRPLHSLSLSLLSLLPSLLLSSSLFHGLASPCAVDQRSIVGSDSMDDAEAAGVEGGEWEGGREGGIVVVELSLPPHRGGQLKRK